MDDEPDEPDFLAELDQALASMKTTATIVYAHYSAMKEAGFSEDRAFELTVQYADAITQHILDEDD